MATVREEWDSYFEEMGRLLERNGRAALEKWGGCSRGMGLFFAYRVLFTSDLSVYLLPF